MVISRVCWMIAGSVSPGLVPAVATPVISTVAPPLSLSVTGSSQPRAATVTVTSAPACSTACLNRGSRGCWRRPGDRWPAVGRRYRPLPRWSRRSRIVSTGLQACLSSPGRRAPPSRPRRCPPLSVTYQTVGNGGYDDRTEPRRAATPTPPTTRHATSGHASRECAADVSPLQSTANHYRTSDRARPNCRAKSSLVASRSTVTSGRHPPGDSRAVVYTVHPGGRRPCRRQG